MQNYLKSELNQYAQPVGLTVQSPDIDFVFEALKGQYVELIPLNDKARIQLHLDQLFENINSEPDQRCWTYLPYEGFKNKAELEYALQHNFNFQPSFHYLILNNQQAVGWIALLAPRMEHGAIEIGNVYFSYRLKRSAAATEVIFLLLSTCFEHGFRRIEWKCNSLNSPSKQAALRFGFSFEGTFRQDRVTKGRNRNTDWYSIIDEEWPQLKRGYQNWLHPDNFDANGQQKITLKQLTLLSQPLK